MKKLLAKLGLINFKKLNEKAFADYQVENQKKLEYIYAAYKKIEDLTAEFEKHSGNFSITINDTQKLVQQAIEQLHELQELNKKSIELVADQNLWIDNNAKN